MISEDIIIKKDTFKLGLNPTEIIVYSFVNTLDGSSATYKMITDTLNISDRTFYRVLNSLESKHLITRRYKRSRKLGKHLCDNNKSTNKYHNILAKIFGFLNK